MSSHCIASPPCPTTNTSPEEELSILYSYHTLVTLAVGRVIVLLKAVTSIILSVTHAV